MLASETFALPVGRDVAQSIRPHLTICNVQHRAGLVKHKLFIIIHIEVDNTQQ
jgi:hypothetical protein